MTTHRYISEGDLFINVYGKSQRVPKGHYYDETIGVLKKNTKQYERSKKMGKDYGDFFQNSKDFFNSAAAGPSTPAEEHVEFELSDSDSNKRQVTLAASKAFGIHYNAASFLFNTGQRIRCRPDQFTRFLIWRAEGVSVNQFQTLKAKLVTEKPAPTFVDVRGN